LWAVAPLTGGQHDRQRLLALLAAQVQLRGPPAAGTAQRVIVGLGRDPARRLCLQIPLFRAPAACWCARVIVESTLTSQVTRPAASAPACSAVRIICQKPARCQRRNNAYAADQEPYVAGMSRHGAPTRTRHRIPSTSCRLLHNDGRPDRDGWGNNDSSVAHCASVRSNRPVTARVVTRSPVFRFFLVDEPITGDLAHY